MKPRTRPASIVVRFEHSIDPNEISIPPEIVVKILANHGESIDYRPYFKLIDAKVHGR